MTGVPWHSFIREQFHIGAFCLQLFLWGILVLALLRSLNNTRQNDPRFQSWRTVRGAFFTWRTMPNIAALLGLTTFIFGDTLKSLWNGFLLKALNEGGEDGAWVKWIENQWEFSLGSVMVATFGLLCAIKWLSPPKWGNLNAISALLITGAVLVALRFVELH